jgi:hypothetical protein
MSKLFGITCFASAVFLATASWAVEVESDQGDVSINQGQGFQKIDGRIDANAGDSVMVSPNGSATVSYPDGCQVNVQPGALVTIAPLSPCASGSLAQVPPPNPYLIPMVIGGLLGAALGVAAYEASQHHSSPTPASP